MDITVSRQFRAFLTSYSSCLTRVSQSEEEGLEVGKVGGGPRGWSGSRDLNVVLEVLFRVIVLEGFDIWALFRAQRSWKAVEHVRLTVKGTVNEIGEGSLTFRRNWASSSSSWRIVVPNLRCSFFSILRSTKNWASWCWTAWRYWNCFMLASGKVWIRALFVPGLVLRLFLVDQFGGQ